MAEVLLFHHAQGLTPGLRAFAEELAGAGHLVHAPDLYEGRTFSTLEKGVAHALLESVEDAELFLYPGEQHLFADSQSLLGRAVGAPTSDQRRHHEPLSQ